MYNVQHYIFLSHERFNNNYIFDFNYSLYLHVCLTWEVYFGFNLLKDWLGQMLTSEAKTNSLFITTRKHLTLKLMDAVHFVN
jgi:hypothetical protein